MKQSKSKENSEPKSGKSPADLQAKIMENPNDITDLVFELFFNKEFKGDVDLSEELKKKQGK